MAPIKDIGQLNDNMLGDRRHTKLTTEASSEEGGRRSKGSSELRYFIPFSFETIWRRKGTTLVLIKSREGEMSICCLSLCFSVGKKKSKKREHVWRVGNASFNISCKMC